MAFTPLRSKMMRHHKVTPMNGAAERRKAILEAKLAEALRHSAEDLEIGSEADPVDAIRTNIDRDISVEQVNRNARVRQEVRAALDNIRSGRYGFCEECGQPITQRRLDAAPWARLCVKCQSQAEVEATKHFGHAA